MNLPGAEFLLRYGGISLVVASAIFFVSTAISRGWIGPVAQLVLATLASFALIGQSFRFTDEQRPWTITLAIGGTAALFVSGVVGYLGLEILTFTAAIVWLLGSVGLFLVLSRLHDAQSIAIASMPAALAGAVLFWAVLLFESEWYELTLLGVAGAVYSLAATATAHGRSWFFARAAGVSAGAFIAGWTILGEASSSSGGTNLVFLGGISLAAVLVGAASQALDFKEQEASSKPSSSALVEARFAAFTIPYISAVVAVIATEFNVFSDDGLWVSAVVAAVLGSTAFALSRLPETMRLLHVGAALATITVSLLGVVDGPVLLVVLLAQTVIAGWLARRFELTDMTVLATLSGVATGVFATGYLIIGILDHGLTTGESIGVLLVVIASGFAARELRDHPRLGDAWALTWLATMAWVAATFRDLPQGQMIITLLWAALGTVMIVAASKLLDRQMINAGLFTLLVTAGKLIFIDLVAVDVLWRAGLFFVVGMLFMRLAFVLPKLINEPTPKPQVNLEDEAAAESDLVNSGGGLG